MSIIMYLPYLISIDANQIINHQHTSLDKMKYLDIIGHQSQNKDNLIKWLHSLKELKKISFCDDQHSNGIKWKRNIKPLQGPFKCSTGKKVNNVILMRKKNGKITIKKMDDEASLSTSNKP